MTLRSPYAEIGAFDIVKHVAIDQNRPPIPESVHPEFAQLIEICWKQDPQQRPDFSQVEIITYLR